MGRCLEEKFVNSHAVGGSKMAAIGAFARGRAVLTTVPVSHAISDSYQGGIAAVALLSPPLPTDTTLPAAVGG
jgi:hypothetical protein